MESSKATLPKDLGEMLVEAKMITEERLQQIKEIQAKNGERIENQSCNSHSATFLALGLRHQVRNSETNPHPRGKNGPRPAKRNESEKQRHDTNHH